MKNIKIEKVVAKNFKSIGGMKVKLNLSDKGLVHVTGKNGLGKSTLLSVLAFGIFGRNVDLKSNSKSSLPVKSLINDINKKELEVEIHLNNGYTIHRGLSPDYFYIEKEGEKLDQRSGKPIDQDYLENEILHGLTFPSFMSTIYLSSKALSTPFLYMTPSGRKEFIEELLDLRIIHYMNEVTKKKISENKLDLMNFKGKLDDLNASIASASSSIKIQEDRKKEQEEKKKEQEDRKKEEFSRLVKESKSDIDDKKFTLNMCNKEIDLHSKELEDKEKELSKYPQDIMDRINEFKDNLRKLELEKTRWDAEKENNDRQLEMFDVCGDCPTKKEFVDVDYSSKYNTFLDKYNEFKNNFESNLKIEEKRLEKFNILSQEINELKSTLREYNTQKESLENEIDRIKSMLLREKKVLDDFLESLNTEIRIDYSHLDYLKKELSSVEEKYDKTVLNKDDLDSIKTTINDKSIKEEIIQHYVPIFENKVNELLSLFMSDDDFSFNVNIDSMFNVEGKKNGKKFNIFSLSNGQLNSVHFAFLFGFLYILELKNLANFDMLFIDELMDSSGLDNDRLQYILDYIKTLSMKKDVYVITHNQNIDIEMFDNRLIVDKVDKFTEYKWVS